MTDAAIAEGTSVPAENESAVEEIQTEPTGETSEATEATEPSGEDHAEAFAGKGVSEIVEAEVL